MKRKTCVSGHVVILSRDKGVTSFRVTKNNGKLTADYLIDTVNEWILEAKAEADVLKDRRDAEQKVKVAEWVKKAKDITVKQNKDGIAYIGVRSDAAGTEKEIEVLLDDDDWRKFMGATANSLPWELTDHIYKVPLDNRRKNIRAATRGANGQNIGKTSKSEFMGVRWYQERWRAQVCVEGEKSVAQTTFEEVNKAVELYDLAVLSQHGVGARLNFVENLSKYLGMLERDATKEFVYGTYRDSGCKGALLVKRELGESDQNARNGLDRSPTHSLDRRKGVESVGTQILDETSSTLEEDSSMTLRWANSAVGGMTAVAPGESTPMKDKIVAKATKEEMRAMNAMGSTPQHGHGHGHHHGHCHHQRHHHGHNWDHRHHRDIAGDNTEFMKRVDIEARDYRYKGDMKG
ncbi:uncharacterized protein UHO2_02637 [Ustilago hordei]|uniref:uncharacterized protein n=1 Tax=Ustilago hordei TaxID=120017 RepID=UPI001A510A86|nr:uncharacterized protein UHO2_02637 [Ustilago hordei]SYW78574.1 related to zinc transporter [Ustilago hordei]